MKLLLVSDDGTLSIPVTQIVFNNHADTATGAHKGVDVLLAAGNTQFPYAFMEGYSLQSPSTVTTGDRDKTLPNVTLPTLDAGVPSDAPGEAPAPEVLPAPLKPRVIYKKRPVEGSYPHQDGDTL